MKIIMMTMITSENPGSFPPSHWDLWHKREACHCAQVTTSFCAQKKKLGRKKRKKSIHSNPSILNDQYPFRDIKTKNILVKRDGSCAIADFGLAVRCLFIFHFHFHILLSLFHFHPVWDQWDWLHFTFTSFHFHFISLSFHFHILSLSPGSTVRQTRLTSPQTLESAQGGTWLQRWETMTIKWW